MFLLFWIYNDNHRTYWSMFCIFFLFSNWKIFKENLSVIHQKKLFSVNCVEWNGPKVGYIQQYEFCMPEYRKEFLP